MFRWSDTLAGMAVALVLPAFAQAAPPRCAPFEDSARFTGMPIDYSVTDAAGPFLLWSCYAKTAADGPWRTRHCIEAPWTAIDLRKIGDRSETIRASPQPLAAWSASYKRHVGPATSARCVALLKALR